MHSVVAAAAAEPGLPPPPVTASLEDHDDNHGYDRDHAAAPAPRAGAADPPLRTPAPVTTTTAETGQGRLVLTEPARVVIPAIRVDTSLVRLGLDDEGRLEVPRDPDDAGWWSGGTAPGDRGPAVIAGHVDSTAGPAVFHRLRELRPGDEIVVAGAEGAVTFKVDGIEQYPKDAFPTEQVYGDTDQPTLRLITCGGTFDRDSGHYEDNVVAYATAR